MNNKMKDVSKLLGVKLGAQGLFRVCSYSLRRFVENLRESFRNATWKLYEAKIRYFEKLCKTDFGEFAAIKGGKGVFWY